MGISALRIENKADYVTDVPGLLTWICAMAVEGGLLAVWQGRWYRCHQFLAPCRQSPLPGMVLDLELFPAQAAQRERA